MSVNERQLSTYVTEIRPRFEDLLGQMVEIPSISMDPAKAPDIRHMAEFARQLLTDLGAEARIVETGGYPIVSGGWMTGAHHPTVTIYNHMDVQPAQEPEWKQAPFTFKNENGLYHGRGATDDKGPALSALFGARYAIEQGVPDQRSVSLGAGRGNRQSPLCGRAEKSNGYSSTGLSRGVGHYLARQRKARHALWSARSAGRKTHASHWNEGCPFRRDGRRRA